MMHRLNNKSLDTHRFLEAYAPLRKNSQQIIDTYPEYLDGLYMTAGHGSRGIISCPIAGEILATMITGESDSTSSLSKPTELLETIHPSRFLIRDLAKKKI